MVGWGPGLVCSRIDACRKLPLPVAFWVQVKTRWDVQMLHSLVYLLDGVYGPAGSVSESRSAIVAQAADIAKVAAGVLGDYLSILDDQYGPSEEDDDELELESERLVDQLDSNDDGEREEAISEISELLKSKQLGYIDIHTHEDLFSLVDYHGALEWLSLELKARLQAARTEYQRLVVDIDDEWSAA